MKISDLFGLLGGEEISVIIQLVVMFSGWIIFFYNEYTDKPKIRGKICQVAFGTIGHPKKPGQHLTTLLCFTYLTNKRKNAVHIIDYELEIDTGKGYERMLRLYGFEKLPEHKFSSEQMEMDIPDFPKKIITADTKPLDYGNPLYGIILFASEKPHEEFVEKDIRKYRLTCIDAFNNRHKIEVTQDKFMPLAQLQYLFDFTVKIK